MNVKSLEGVGSDWHKLNLTFSRTISNDGKDLHQSDILQWSFQFSSIRAQHNSVQFTSLVGQYSNTIMNSFSLRAIQHSFTPLTNTWILSWILILIFFIPRLPPLHCCCCSALAETSTLTCMEGKVFKKVDCMLSTLPVHCTTNNSASYISGGDRSSNKKSCYWSPRRLSWKIASTNASPTRCGWTFQVAHTKMEGKVKIDVCLGKNYQTI